MDVERPQLAAWFETLSPMKRADAVAQLREALGDILSVRLINDDEAANWSDALEKTANGLFETVTQTTDTKSQTMSNLIGVLVTRPPQDLKIRVAMLVADTAEILFLARPLRSEYQKTEGPPPYLIAKLLLEYALLSRKLDRLMGALNKSFCTTRCPSPPVGCCHLLGYDLGLIPDKMLAAQAVEAKNRGWQLPPNPDLRKCRYHTDTGCALRLFKTPACIGAMCASVEANLDCRFLPGPLARFRTAMTNFRNCDIDREAVFVAMTELIEEGEAIVSSPR